MCYRAGSGHPGGSLSSIDILLLLWSCMRAGPASTLNPQPSTFNLSRDRIVLSHGHAAAGLYAALIQVGGISREEVLAGFRRAGSRFEGHPALSVPGVEWSSGNLGQGLSVGCGFALGARLRGEDGHVAVVMGDGEQQKGPVHEAARFASKYRLGSLMAVIDCNGLQAMGPTEEVMPLRMAEEYAALGWKVEEVDGHDFGALYDVLRGYYHRKDGPAVVLAHTVMGKGVSFMEDRSLYHGKPLGAEEYERGIRELGAELEQNEAGTNQSAAALEPTGAEQEPAGPVIDPGQPRSYPVGSLECRSAFGKALLDLAVANAGRVPLAVLDCDLADSVRTAELAKAFPGSLIQCGIAEHNAATIAGALARMGVLTFFADFAVFGLNETFNQQRLNDINRSPLKLVVTHCGLDVGEDGKTHQCMDYIGATASWYHAKLLIPADANQADQMTRYAAQAPGFVVLAMGRSKLPVLLREEGTPFFGADYRFAYGAADWLRQGSQCAIVTCGTMVHRAVAARESLRAQGVSAGVLNIGTPLALDAARLEEAARTGLIVTYEDHNVRTGLGVLVGAFIARQAWGCRVICLGPQITGNRAGRTTCTLARA
jgi:transketolase